MRVALKGLCCASPSRPNASEWISLIRLSSGRLPFSSAVVRWATLNSTLTRTLVLLSLELLLSSPLLRAQDEVRCVQEELRRRSLYFGNVDGRESAELADATRRYQRRKGSAPT